MTIESITKVQLHESITYHLSIMENDKTCIIIPICKESHKTILQRFKNDISEFATKNIEGGGILEKHFFKAE
jgi:hypothetical protein